MRIGLFLLALNAFAQSTNQLEIIPKQDLSAVGKLGLRDKQATHHTIWFTAPSSVSADKTFVWPGSYGTAADCLKGNGGGGLYWDSCGGGSATLPFSDVSALLMNDTDHTATLRFDLSAIATGTLRVASMPDANITLVGAENAQTISGAKTHSSSLTLNANIPLQFNRGAGLERAAYWLSGGTKRWAFGADASAESGSNSGSDLFLRAYDDSGASLGDAFSIDRATRDLTFGSAVFFTGDLHTAADNTLNIGSSYTRFASAFAGTGNFRSLEIADSSVGGSPSAYRLTAVVQPGTNSTLWLADDVGTNVLQVHRKASSIALNYTSVYTDWHPAVDKAESLGSPYTSWQDLYADSIYVDTLLRPRTNGTVPLGSSSLRFSNTFSNYFTGKYGLTLTSDSGTSPTVTLNTASGSDSVVIAMNNTGQRSWKVATDRGTDKLLVGDDTAGKYLKIAGGTGNAELPGDLTIGGDLSFNFLTANGAAFNGTVSLYAGGEVRNSSTFNIRSGSTFNLNGGSTFNASVDPQFDRASETSSRLIYLNVAGSSSSAGSWQYGVGSDGGGHSEFQWFYGGSGTPVATIGPTGNMDISGYLGADHLFISGSTTSTISGGLWLLGGAEVRSSSTVQVRSGSTLNLNAGSIFTASIDILLDRAAETNSRYLNFTVGGSGAVAGAWVLGPASDGAGHSQFALLYGGSGTPLFAIDRFGGVSADSFIATSSIATLYLNATGPVSGASYKVGSTTIVDASRNLSNVGTISNSGLITAGAGLTLNGANLTLNSVNIVVGSGSPQIGSTGSHINSIFSDYASIYSALYVKSGASLVIQSGGAINITGGSTGNVLTRDASGNGYWAAPAGGGGGTVTSIATSGPITGGTITASGTIGCPTCVTTAGGVTVTGGLAFSSNNLTLSGVNLVTGGTTVQLGASSARINNIFTEYQTVYSTLQIPSGAALNIQSGSTVYSGGTAGATKTCTVLPTVVNGIITSC